MTGLSRHFQSLDTTGDGTLDKDELKEALKQFNIQIPVEVQRRQFKFNQIDRLCKDYIVNIDDQWSFFPNRLCILKTHANHNYMHLQIMLISNELE